MVSDNRPNGAWFLRSRSARPLRLRLAILLTGRPLSKGTLILPLRWSSIACEDPIMRATVLFAVLALVLAFGVAGLASVSPASARDYRWCVQGRGVGYPGDCMYQTRAQCLASASGRNVTCGINPRAAYGQQRRGYRDRY
ncbi:DUF3551 domain-containing protein [Bradyrhizobium brasilense]|uniref:DUF3551 domain-containing protein n=1 Tax=Bradyrhizobium brasilense TaxID=1419277 RepID=UPI003D3197AC